MTKPVDPGNKNKAITGVELEKNWWTKRYIKCSSFDKKYSHVHPCESKPLNTNMQSFLKYIATVHMTKIAENLGLSLGFVVFNFLGYRVLMGSCLGLDLGFSYPVGTTVST